MASIQQNTVVCAAGPVRSDSAHILSGGLGPALRSLDGAHRQLHRNDAEFRVADVLSHAAALVGTLALVAHRGDGRVLGGAARGPRGRLLLIAGARGRRRRRTRRRSADSQTIDSTTDSASAAALAFEPIRTRLPLPAQTRGALRSAHNTFRGLFNTRPLEPGRIFHYLFGILLQTRSFFLHFISQLASS